jgi:hypothetical protein
VAWCADLGHIGVFDIVKSSAADHVTVGGSAYPAVSRLLLPGGEDGKHRGKCAWVCPIGTKDDRKARGDVARVTSFVCTPEGKTWQVAALYIDRELVRLALLPHMMAPVSDANGVWDVSCKDVSLPVSSGREPDSAEFDELRAKAISWLNCKEHSPIKLSTSHVHVRAF